MAKLVKPEGIKKPGERIRKVNMILYGDPGSQKTRRGPGTSPRLLLLNADGPDGPESIRYEDRLRLFGGDKEKASYEIQDVSEIDHLNDTLDYLRRLCRIRVARKQPLPYDWAWFDSATLFQELHMDEIMRDLVKKKDHRDPDVPDMAQYLKEQNALMKWVRHMKALPINFGITAHIMRLEDGDGEVTMLPAISGGSKIPLATKACGYMSIVGRMYVVTSRKGGKNGKLVETPMMQTRKSEKFYAKDRFGVLEPRIQRPTIPMIMSVIFGEEQIKNG